MRPRSPPAVLAYACMVCSGVVLEASGAQAESRVNIDVVGSMRVRAERTSEGDQPRVRGIVEDEMGRPLEGARISIPPSGTPPTPDQSRSVESDSSGAFELSDPNVSDIISVKVVHDGFESLSLSLPRGSAIVAPEIIYAPRTIDLDSDHAESVLVRHSNIPTFQLELWVRRGDQVYPVAKVPAQANGQTDVPFSSRSLPGPGQLEWIVRQGKQESPAWPLLSRAKVTISLANTSETRTNVVLTLKLTAHGLPVSRGRVEIDLPGARRISAAVMEGKAQLALPKEERATSITIHYAPLDPEYLAGSSLPFTTSARRPLIPTSAWHGLLGLVFIAWLLKRWVLGSRAIQRTSMSPAGPEAIVARSPTSGEKTGIAGTLHDAHTGDPVPKARVTLLGVGAAREEALASSETDEHGRFVVLPASGKELKASPWALRVEAKGYRTLQAAVRPGVLQVRIVERRRALLADLTDWAKKGGVPWKELRAPTPLELAQAARKRGLLEQSAWAERINQEAFGQEPPEHDRGPDSDVAR